jgi:hypothetical protein
MAETERWSIRVVVSEYTKTPVNQQVIQIKPLESLTISHSTKAKICPLDYQPLNLAQSLESVIHYFSMGRFQLTLSFQHFIVLSQAARRWILLLEDDDSSRVSEIMDDLMEIKSG